MSRQRLVTAFMAGIVTIAVPAFSQETSRQDVAVQAFGSFVTGTTQNGIYNDATNSGGVLGSYRYFFSRHHGVEANYGFSLNTLRYSSADGALGFRTQQHEVSGAYVFRLPMKKVTPFALAGVGALVFDPTDFVGANTQTRAAFVYGAGADVNLTSHVFLRAEYRGLVYNSPTYDFAAVAVADRVTHRAEPSIGFGYRF